MHTLFYHFFSPSIIHDEKNYPKGFVADYAFCIKRRRILKTFHQTTFFDYTTDGNVYFI